MNEMISTFSARFSILFEESQKTTAELAKDLHVSNQAISAWKTGARTPKDLTIVSVANYFGVNPAWLMGYDVPRIPDDTVYLTEGIKKASEMMRIPDYSMSFHPSVIGMLDSIIQEDETKAQARDRIHQNVLKLGKIYESLTPEGQDYLMQQADIAKKMFKK